MLYFTNQELAEANHVSVRTVRNWIDAAREGKLDLTLHSKGQRYYIANTSKNTLIIKDLVSKNKKYRPHRAQKTVMPQSKFYDLYTQEQLYDIASNLEINREIPRQYNYFGEGADNWDKYAQHLVDETSPNYLKSTIELYQINKAYVDDILEVYDQVNVIDIGVGNALPTRGLLEHLIEKGKMGRYIALDVSPQMLSIARKNIEDWFGDTITFEGFNTDITHDRFGYLLADEYIKTDSEKTTNLLLFTGGTIANFKKQGSVLEVIHDSMGIHDYLIHTQKLDTESSRRQFNFDPKSGNPGLAPIHRYIFDLLNIDESFYEMDMGYDPTVKERYIRVRLKIALSIKFRFEGGERIVDFNKGDGILLWRAHQNSLFEVVRLFTNADFYPLQISQTNQDGYVMTISRIKREEV